MSEENRKKEETMEEPTREMEKETGAETDLPETEPAAEQEEAKKAQESARALFSTGVAAQMPTCELTDEDMEDGSIDLISVLCKAGLVNTRSEGRRAIEQGGVTVGEDKVTDVKAAYAKDAFAGEGLVVKRGKKNFRKIIVK